MGLAKTSNQILRRVPTAWTKTGILGFELLRTLTFFSQNLGLLLLNEKKRAQRPEFASHLKMILQDLTRLLEQDADNIVRGIYPLEVLKPESAKTFFWRYPQILWDSLAVSKRRLQHKAKDFNHEARQYLADVPEYFQRNFHFQTGGYLTEKSAALYEHQVEILFSGAADAMRRLLLPLLREHFVLSEGEGLHFLEIAAGTGRLSRFVKLTFPKAKVTVLDLSDPYLRRARENLKEFRRIDFVQGDAAQLPFAEQKFDAVYSCFLFHELPLGERKKVISEAFRVLKPGGFFGLVDAAQEEDKKDFSWALDQFPVDFHEPFFKNYRQHPMETLLEGQGFGELRSHLGFFSKALAGKKI
jgi:ubiquinone/menaquinone biosynthesis C-methylase UbiE